MITRSPPHPITPTSPRPIRCPNCRRWLLNATPPIAYVETRCPSCKHTVIIQGAQALTAHLAADPSITL